MASGNTLITFSAQNMQQPGSSFAFLGTRNTHPIVVFPDAGDKAALFGSLLPRHYSNSGVIITLMWAAISVTPAQVCRWAAAFERLEAAGTDIDADSFGTEKTADGNPVTTSGALIYTTLTFTNGELDGIIAGEAFRLRIRRITTGVSGNMVGNAQLVFVSIREA
jgi:hypothetical protein